MTTEDNSNAPVQAAAPEKAAGNTKEVLYRKYRFSSFNEMCGQEQVSSFFINAVKYNKISHAYLFSGPRGTGKTSMARLFAKILNCTGKTTYEPCGKCINCIEFEKGSAVDIIEMDAASNRKIENIRSLRDDVSFMPVMGRYKIFILDEAHMLTTEAANAFLKTLEEPPPHVIFILATTEMNKLPPTILSRCQLVSFSRISVADIIKRLEFVVNEENKSRGEGEKVKYEKAALLMIAKKAQGGMRDALSLLEYVMALCHGGSIESDAVEKLLGVHSTRAIGEFVESIISKNVDNGLKTIRKVHAAGNEIITFIEALNSYLTALILIKIGVTEKSFLECDEDDFNAMGRISEKFERTSLFKLLEIYSECLSAIRFAPDQLTHLEFVYIKSIMALDARPAEPETKSVAAPALDIRQIENIISQKLSALKAYQPPPAAVKQQAASAETFQGAPAAPKAASKLTLDKLKLAWQSTFLPQIKQASIPTHAIISSGLLAKMADGCVELDFTKNVFCGERMLSGSHLKIAEDVFCQVFGENVKFKILLPSANKAEHAETRKKEILEEKKKDPMVQKILQEFDGEIVDVQEH